MGFKTSTTVSCAIGALLAAAVLPPVVCLTSSTAMAQAAAPQAATPLPTIPVQTKKKKKPAKRHHAPVHETIRQTPDAPETNVAPEPSAEVAAVREKGISTPLNGSEVRGESVKAERAATNDTAAMLHSVPGVNVYSGGGVSSLPDIHGLNDERINTTVNGMPIVSACGNHMNPPLSYVDPTAVHHIDVMAGISPVSAGGDSLGSVIAVESGAPQFAEAGEGLVTHGSVSAYVRSNNANIGGSAMASVATSNFSATYTGAWTRASNYTDGHGDEVKSTLYEAQNQMLTLAARGSSDVLVVQGGIQKIPYQGFVNQWMDMTDNEAWFVNGRYEKKLDWGKLYIQAYYQHTDHEMEFLDDKKRGRLEMARRTGMGMPNMPMDTEGQNMGYKVKAEIPLTASDMLRVGNELHRTTLDDWWPPVPNSKGQWVPGGMMCCDTFWNVNGGERTRLGTFVELESKWSRQWTTLVGVRNDVVWMDTGDVQGYSMMYAADAMKFNALDHAKTDVNFDVTAQARYEPDANSSYELGYARKTRSPSLYERYTWSTNGMAMSMNGWFGDSNGYVGDINLRPEIANTVSFTAGWHDRARKDWEIKVTPYYTYVEDYIGVDKMRDNCPVGHPAGTPCPFMPTGNGTNSMLRFANQNAELYGVDVSASKVLWRSEDFGRFTIMGALNYVHGEDADTGAPLYHIMPLNGRIGLQHKLGHWSNAVELDLVSEKSDVDPARKELPTAGYALVNLRSSYEWERIRLDFGVQNLFNQYYQLPLGGIDIGYMPINYPVHNVAGMGRNVYVGLTMKF